MKLSAAATDKQVLVTEEVDWPDSMIHFPKASTPLQLSSRLWELCVCVWGEDGDVGRLSSLQTGCYIPKKLKLELLTPNRKRWNSDDFRHVIKFGRQRLTCWKTFPDVQSEAVLQFFLPFFGLLPGLRGGMFWTEQWQPRCIRGVCFDSPHFSQKTPHLSLLPSSPSPFLLWSCRSL